MKSRNSCIAMAVALSLSACGGGDGATDSTAAAPALAKPMSKTGPQSLAAVNGVTVIPFSGNRADYAIAATADGFSVTHLAGNGGTVNVTSLQRLQFADVNIAFDLVGVPGKAYRLYRAAFNRVPDLPGLGYWLNVMDNGALLDAVAAGFMSSKEFADLYGVAPNDTELLTAYYANVMHRVPDIDGLNWWLAELAKGIARNDVLVAFSESPENQGQVLADIANGIAYVPQNRLAIDTVPGAPAISAIAGASGAASVSSPLLDGGQAITAYTATCSGNGVVVSASAAASPVQLVGLSNGVQYTCTVKATNALGSGLASAALTVTPMASATVPGAPVILSSAAGNAMVTLGFGAPTANGGSAVTGYVAVCTGGGASRSASGAASPLAVTGLSNGVTYACNVAAANAVGTGPVSGTVLATPVAPVVVSVPGAPTLLGVTAGNASAAVSFSAPTSNGGAAISLYTASCSGGGATRTASAAASPITVSSLTNGISYSCSVTAANSAGSSAASSALTVMPAVGSSTITGSLFCGYSASVLNAPLNLTSTVSTTCTGSTRTMAGNGVPDHVAGTFPNSGNPNAIKAVSFTFNNTLNPAVVSSTGTAVDHVLGYANNGVKFDPSTAESYQNAGVWKIEALNQTYFAFGVDSSNAHVQPNGAYHYHGMPEGYVTRLNKGTGMALVGFAVDGFPIYARYGYNTATNAASGAKVMVSSYRMKTTPSSGRPSTSTVPMGTFTQDYEYVAGLGDLDECNGRTGVTPEFPSGIYHYYITDSYPYIQRCVKGTATPTGRP